jgi:hypothetical protein
LPGRGFYRSIVTHLLRRQLIRDRLRLKWRASYRIIGPSRPSPINSDEVLQLLNNARRGGIPYLHDIPSDLRTPDEMAAEIEGVTAHDLLNWTRRTKNVAPHFRINKQTTRFSASRLLAWLEERTRVVRKRIT